ncbi:MAG: type II 3-dehydroquinate dehydratase [Clostridia bacterium]|nr:type II 3-dehydroquinate dehydratase [Clostridia bacterium]
MKLLVINGPNLNMLGIREPEIYGRHTLSDLEEMLRESFPEISFTFFQSNHEGAIVDEIQRAYGVMDGIIINPAAYTHTSIAILDALKAVGLPAVEVHLSDISARESFRRHSYISAACLATIAGRHFEGYREAASLLVSHLS